jgi:hypothetical protein
LATSGAALSNSLARPGPEALATNSVAWFPLTSSAPEDVLLVDRVPHVGLGLVRLDLQRRAGLLLDLVDERRVGGAGDAERDLMRLRGAQRLDVRGNEQAHEHERDAESGGERLPLLHPGSRS